MTNQTNGAPAPTTDDAPAVMRHAEAPYSANVKAYDPEGFDMMFTVRDEDGARFIGRVNKLRSWLVREGFTPTRSATNANVAPPPQANGGQAQPPAAFLVYGPDGAPECSLHGGPLKASQYGGAFCPKKLDDGSYCKVVHKP